MPCHSSLVVQDTGGNEAARVINEAPSISAVRWLPSGTSLIIAAKLDSARNGIFVVPRLGGSARQIAAPGIFDVDPTGDSLLFVARVGGVQTSRFAYVIPLATGIAKDSLKIPFTEVAAVAWSPNGLFVAINTGQKIFILRRNGVLVDSTHGGGRATLRWTPTGDAVVSFFSAPARDDELMRIPVSRDGHFSSSATQIMPRLQALYRGEFDIAQRSGDLAFISGDALADQWVFGIGSKRSMPPRRVTSGTSWYAKPAISDDGRTLYFLRGNGTGDNLYRVQLNAGTVREEAMSTGSGAGLGSDSPVSPDGARVVFQRVEGEKRVLYDVAAATQRITNRDTAGATWPSRVVPFGASGLAAIPRGNNGLMISDSASVKVRTLSAPDSLRVLKHTISTDGRSAALLVVTATGSAIGVTSLASWDFRPLVQFNGPVLNTALSWPKDGWLYYVRWETSAPVLYRVQTIGAPQPLERVMTLPVQCMLETVVVSTGSDMGACQAQQNRGDVYLAGIPRLTR